MSQELPDHVVLVPLTEFLGRAFIAVERVSFLP